MPSLSDRFSPWLLWTLLSLPPLWWGWEAATSDNPRMIHILVHPTGEWSARLLILTLLATPLAMALGNNRFTAWLRRNRRYLGVASFAYAAQHTLFYVIDKGALDVVLSQAGRFYIWTGWLAFFIFIPLGATSMDAAVRAMGPAWKSLQRWVYAAAVLTLLHWAALHGWKHPMGAIVHFAPLAALEAWRMWKIRSRRAERAAA